MRRQGSGELPPPWARVTSAPERRGAGASSAAQLSTPRLMWRRPLLEMAMRERAPSRSRELPVVPADSIDALSAFTFFVIRVRLLIVRDQAHNRQESV